MSKTWGQSGSRLDRGVHKRGNTMSNGKGIRLIISPYYDKLIKRIRYTKAYPYQQRTPDGKTILHHEYR